jgi:hypothetical protein
VFFAEFAILFHFNSVGSIFLVFVCTVVAIFAFCTRKRNICAHLFTVTENLLKVKNFYDEFLSLNLKAKALQFGAVKIKTFQ